jgi:hypothetical protein
MPLYARVSGELPVGGLKAVRAELEVTTPGKVRLRLNSEKGLTIDVDGASVPAAGTVELQLKEGRHAVTFTLSGRAEPLRVEVDEAPGSPARVRPLGGK